MTLIYPARFMLVAAMNPCPCGYFGSPEHPCKCCIHQVSRYRDRISGPILDPIDLHLEVPAVRYADLRSTAPAEPSAAIRERVIAARKRQLERCAGNGIYASALMIL
jgi:magnesium chelatase family protein